jgi:hypothetical protein
MSTQNYALDNPIKRKVYLPGEDDVGFAPIKEPMKNSETDQTHRNLTWLFHKPREHAYFPIQPTAVKIEKKK